MRTSIYFLLMIGLTVATVLAFDYLIQQPPSDFLQGQKKVLGALSAFFNGFVLYYHASRPPHPKFVMLPHRRVILGIHIVAGCLEFAACLVAYATDSAAWAIGAALLAILGHVPTSYYQTSIVFGSKAIMVASYVFAISLHLFCALHLLYEPTSTFWLLNTFLVLSIYVWVRVFYSLFSRIGLFENSLYTASVLMAVMILLPAVLGGVSANLLYMSYVLATVGLYYAVVQPDAPARLAFVSESARDLMVSPATKLAQPPTEAISRAEKQPAPGRYTFPQDATVAGRQARFVFTRLDTDHNNFIEAQELEKLLRQWGLPAGESAAYLRPYPDARISFEEFSSQMKPVWQFIYGNLRVQSLN